MQVQPPGLYEVSWGFYTRSVPVVTVLINNEEVYSKTSDKEIPRHPAGNVWGLTSVEFLACPANACISVRYDGSPAEGFLSLRKI